AMSDADAAPMSAAESERLTHEQGFTAGHNPWVIALTVTLATFMEVLDTTISNVSLNHIAGRLSVSEDESTWVPTSCRGSHAILSARVVQDPPHLVEAKKRAGRIDYVGLALIAVGLGALEYVLDKGQEDDWFNSHTIVLFVVIAAVALVSFILWELREEHPVVDVRLFKNAS